MLFIFQKYFVFIVLLIFVNFFTFQIIEKLKKARSCLLNAPLNIHIDCSENFLDEAEKLKDLQQIHNISVNRDGKISFQVISNISYNRDINEF